MFVKRFFFKRRKQGGLLVYAMLHKQFAVHSTYNKNNMQDVSPFEKIDIHFHVFIIDKMEMNG